MLAPYHVSYPSGIVPLAAVEGISSIGKLGLVVIIEMIRKEPLIIGAEQSPLNLRRTGPERTSYHVRSSQEPFFGSPKTVIRERQADLA